MDGETHFGRGGEEASRAPERKDLSRICAELNRLGAKYIVVGGFAVIEAGYPRFTSDIDLLIDVSPENEALTFEALRVLPDKAVNELDAGDVAKFTVVRIADEVLIDLMANACGVDYTTAIQDAEYRDINGARIPFASPRTLLKMKQTVRDKDIADRAFLRGLIESEAANSKAQESSLLESLREALKGKPKS